jgi:hypothetical protein
VKKALFILMAAIALMCRAEQPGGTASPSALAGYMDPGMEVVGVRSPYYDDEGVLQAQLYGEYAKVLEGGKADITNLRIDIYQDGEVTMTVFAPQCFTRVEESQGKKILTAHSDGIVLIEMEQMTISGRGFRFTSKNNRFEIMNDSKVLVRESFKNMKEISL